MSAPAPPSATAPGDLDAWERLEALIDDRQRFLLTTHINPDGDGIGSSVALAQHLRDRGKDVELLAATPLPGNLRFLQDPTLRIPVYDDTIHRQRVLTSDVLLILDTAEWTRVGPLGEVIRNANGTLAVIDHHVCEQRIGDVFLSAPHASSTGELIYHLIKRRGGELTPVIASALYVAIGSDCGWFRFNNTTPAVLRIAAELLDAGADNDRLYRELYETTTWEDVELFRRLLATMQHHLDERVVTIHLDKTDYERFSGGDTDRILNYALTIPQTEVVLFFKQVARTATKLSLRSRGDLDIGALARRHGGGGHRNASGILAQLQPEELERAVMTELELMFDQREQLAEQRG